MRMWHEKLIPKLCRLHLLAMWREGLGIYSIIINNKKGYRNHPAVKEFEKYPLNLWFRLSRVQDEMLKRGYNPKDMPHFPKGTRLKDLVNLPHIKPYQSLNEQIEILRSKKCECKV